MMDDTTIIEIAGNAASAAEGILMDALEDAGYAATSLALRSYREGNAVQLEYWRERLAGDREHWSPRAIERYWGHIHSLRRTYDSALQDTQNPSK